jgi:hypothetical protein
MSNEQNKAHLLDDLRKPVLTQLQVEKLLARPTASETRCSLLRRCVKFLRTILEPFALAIGGYAMGIVLVAIAHYAGLDPWLDSMINR